MKHISAQVKWSGFEGNVDSCIASALLLQLNLDITRLTKVHNFLSHAGFELRLAVMKQKRNQNARHQRMWTMPSRIYFTVQNFVICALCFGTSLGTTQRSAEARSLTPVFTNVTELSILPFETFWCLNAFEGPNLSLQGAFSQTWCSFPHSKMVRRC